eukprot:749980-Hanusia_phi.AAC.2
MFLQFYFDPLYESSAQLLKRPVPSTWNVRNCSQTRYQVLLVMVVLSDDRSSKVELEKLASAIETKLQAQAKALGMVRAYVTATLQVRMLNRRRGGEVHDGWPPQTATEKVLQHLKDSNGQANAGDQGEGSVLNGDVDSSQSSTRGDVELALAAYVQYQSVAQGASLVCSFFLTRLLFL